MTQNFCASLEKRARPRRYFLLFPPAWQPSHWWWWWAVISWLTSPRIVLKLLTSYYLGFRVAEICPAGNSTQELSFFLTNVSLQPCCSCGLCDFQVGLEPRSELIGLEEQSVLQCFNQPSQTLCVCVCARTCVKTLSSRLAIWNDNPPGLAPFNSDISCNSLVPSKTQAKERYFFLK